MFGFVKDIWLRIYTEPCGKPLTGEKGEIRIVTSRGYYGLWFCDDKGQTKFIWFGDPVIASVTWPLMIGSETKLHSTGEMSYQIGLRRTRFTVTCDEKNITLAVGNCSVVFGSEQIEELSAILDGLKL